ncbi:MAG: lipase maturation factor family protein [Gemmatimonadota bacterium]
MARQRVAGAATAQAAHSFPRNDLEDLASDVYFQAIRPDAPSSRDGNPFPEGPPRVVRARLYLYPFTTVAERRETGCRWKRERVGEYVPAIGLR